MPPRVIPQKCSFDWCTRPAAAKGMCRTCYGREWARAKVSTDPEALDRKRAINRKWAAGRAVRPVTVTEKRCGQCGATKAAEEFYRQKLAPDGLQSVCTDCSKQNQLDYALTRRCKNVGITVEHYHQLWREQEGLCALCTRVATDLDHCHATGKFRGLICAACNRILGTVQDDAALLRRLADYIDNAGPGIR